jgi:aspartate--ammonia ligase
MKKDFLYLEGKEMTIVPKHYKAALRLYETQKAIGLIKNVFQVKLCAALHLKRVTAPLFVDPSTGLNDDLNGVERPVSFDVPAVGIDAQVVHSLAKWKRLALYEYDFYVGNGLITDMNAIRRDEELDNLHSIYVDQWDWEKVIDRGMRNREYLHETVNRIVSAICGTLDELKWQFSNLETELCRDVTFVTSQELEDMYPDLTPKERENAFVKEHKTVFIEQIGGKLRSGKPHDGRAPDYDDWQLNGDLLFWHDVLGIALEISSMGIRVDAESLDRQLTESGCDNRRTLPFHSMLLENKLPLTIGGGIGQSRLCMLLLGKAHIGEVQASIWDEETKEICKENHIVLL